MFRLILIALLLLPIHLLHAEGDAVKDDSVSSITTSNGWMDLSKMNAKEILDFYKKNPDFAKKRIGLDYEKYVLGDWVVLRGELLSIDWKGREWILVSGAIPGVIDEEYLAVTNEQGIFNLEFSKSLFKDDSSYTVKINLDGLQASSSLKTGKEMKDASIFHFKILATKDGQTIETIKNQIFSSLKKTENIKKLSSFFGIQGISLLVVLISISALLGLSYYRTKQKRAQDG